MSTAVGLKFTGATRATLSGRDPQITEVQRPVVPGSPVMACGHAWLRSPPWAAPLDLPQLLCCAHPSQAAPTHGWTGWGPSAVGPCGMGGSSHGSCGSRSVARSELMQSVWSFKALPTQPSFLPHLPIHSSIFGPSPVPLLPWLCLIPSWCLLPGEPEPTPKLWNCIPPRVVASSLLLLVWAVHPPKTEEMRAPLPKGEAVLPPPTSSRHLPWSLWKSSPRSSPKPASLSNGTCHRSGLLAQKPRQKLREVSHLCLMPLSVWAAWDLAHTDWGQ